MEVNNEIKTMDDVIREIVEKCKEVEIIGNKFIFNPAEECGKFNVTVNGKNFLGSISYQLDNLILEIKSSFTDRRNDFCFKYNNKTYSYGKGAVKVPVYIILNKDLSLKEMSTSMISQIIAVNDKGERCYLPKSCIDFYIINQNFYTFDKNKNITGIKQQETFKMDSNFIEDLEFKELSKIQEKEADKKVGLLVFFSKKAKEEDASDFYVTFTKDSVFALIGKKLFFCKKNDTGYDITTVKEIGHGKSIPCGLTAFDGKVFVEYDDIGKGVLVFDEKTNNLKTDLKDKNLFQMGYFNFKQMRPLFNNDEFQKKLSVYFDKNAKTKEKVKKENKEKNQKTPKTNLNYKKCIIY